MSGVGWADSARAKVADEGVKPLAEENHAGPGRGKTDDNSTRFAEGSTSALSLIRRLKGDHPSGAAALANGGVPQRPGRRGRGGHRAAEGGVAGLQPARRPLPPHEEGNHGQDQKHYQ
jgi:hypothetical protein